MFRIVDLSEYQAGVDFHRLKASGVAAVWLKATEGMTWTDPDFQGRRRAANEAGLHVGAYHFAHPDRNLPGAEADHFVSVVRMIGTTDLLPFLDFETWNKKLSAEEHVAWARTFNARVRALLGRWPGFYSYSAMLHELHPPKTIGGFLVLSDFSRNDGAVHPAVVPAPWKRWNAHQYTSKAHVAGVDGPVDMSEAPSLRPLLAHPVRVRIARAGAGLVRDL